MNIVNTTVFLALSFLFLSSCEGTSAVCRLDHSGKGNVRGEIRIEQGNGQTSRFSGTIAGLSPGLHGFHVHQFGDTRDKCKAAGGHFNPFQNNHGAPNTNARHIGDLGNIETGLSGRTRLNIVDHLALLRGPHSILGRAIVIHEGVDDMGLGGHKDSLKTGNAGGRVACCIIQETFPVFSVKFFQNLMARFGLI